MNNTVHCWTKVDKVDTTELEYFLIASGNMIHESGPHITFVVHTSVYTVFSGKAVQSQLIRSGFVIDILKPFRVTQLMVL